MEILHTSALPAPYIGEMHINIPLQNSSGLDIWVRFTVFGELLAYECPILELPEAALKLSFGEEEVASIHHELALLPYRLLMLAFDFHEIILQSDHTVPCWSLLSKEFKRIRNGRDIFALPVAPSTQYAQQLIAWKWRDPMYIDEVRISVLLICLKKERTDLLRFVKYDDDPILIAPLLSLKNSSDFSVRNTLSRFGRAIVQPVIDKLDDLISQSKPPTAQLIQMLAQNDAAAINWLEKRLAIETDHALQDKMIIALYSTGNPDIVKRAITDANRKALFSRSPEVIKAFFRVLTLESFQNVGRIFQFYLDNWRETDLVSDEVLTAVLEGIADLQPNSPSIISTILEIAAQHPDKKVRAAAIKTLDCCKPEMVSPFFTNILQDKASEDHESVIKSTNSYFYVTNINFCTDLATELAAHLEVGKPYNIYILSNIRSSGDVHAISFIDRYIKTVTNFADKCQALIDKYRIGDPSGLRGLIELEGDENAANLATLALYLGLTQDELAIEPLLRLLDHTELEVRTTVVSAFGEWQVPEALPKICQMLEEETDEKILDKLASACCHFDNPDAIPSLWIALGRVQHKRPYQSVGIAHAIAKLGDPAISPTLETLLSKGMVFSSIYALEYINAPRAKELLLFVASYGNLDDYDKQFVADALVRHNHPRGLVLLREKVRLRGTKKTDALRSLIKLKDPGLLPILAEQLQEGDQNDRVSAILYIGYLGLQEGRALLLPCLEESDERIALSAACALAKLGDATGLDMLMKNVGHTFNEPRIAVIKALGDLRRTEAFDPLVQELESNHTGICQAAVTALGKLGDPRAISHLQSRLQTLHHSKTKALILETVEALGGAN